MTPPPGVTFSELDSADATDDGQDIFMLLLLSDGSEIGVTVPVAELIRRGHAVVEPAAAPALYVVPVLQ